MLFAVSIMETASSTKDQDKCCGLASLSVKECDVLYPKRVMETEGRETFAIGKSYISQMRGHYLLQISFASGHSSEVVAGRQPLPLYH